MPRFVTIAALILTLSPFAASAEVFRCLKDGTTSFSDKPCAQDAQTYTPKPIQVVPAGKSPDLAKQYDQRITEGAKATDKDYQAKKQQDEAIRNARIDGKVVVGMSQLQVKGTSGEPQIKSRNENLGVVREGWTYKNQDGSRSIVYFKNGVVSSTVFKEHK